MKSLEELCNIAISIGKPLEHLLYEMLVDAMNEIDRLNGVIDMILENTFYDGDCPIGFDDTQDNEAKQVLTEMTDSSCVFCENNTNCF